MGKSCKPRKMLQSKLFVAKAASIQSRTDLPKFGVDLASIQRIRRLFPSLPTSPPVKPPAHLYPLFYLGSTTAFGVLLLSACSSLWNIKLMICRFFKCPKRSCADPASLGINILSLEPKRQQNFVTANFNHLQRLWQ